MADDAREISQGDEDDDRIAGEAGFRCVSVPSDYHDQFTDVARTTKNANLAGD